MSKNYVCVILISLTFTLKFGIAYGEEKRIVANSVPPNSTLTDVKKTRVILLGTRGGPRVGLGRNNPATLILINEIPYLIDCGYGTSHQLVAAGVPLERLRYIFITHHHSDHNLDYGPLLYNAWVTSKAGRIDAYGPPGIEKMTDDFFQYLHFDINTRMQDEGRSNPREIVFAHEIDKPGVILSNNDVQVSALLVRHPPIKYAFAYRFNAKGRSIVISGDTAFSPELANFARGADILIHEVMYLPGIESLLKRVPNAKRLRAHLLVTHTLPEDVGRVAADAGVKTLVLTHFVPGDDSSITDERWSAGVRKNFKGRIVVGKDMMEIETQ